MFNRDTALEQKGNPASIKRFRLAGTHQEISLIRLNVEKRNKMTNNLEHQHEIIKKSLFQFINTHIVSADLGIVDEIVCSYVVSVLEEASQDDGFEVAEFITMMSAYFPDFSQIEIPTVWNWITELNAKLSENSTSVEVQHLTLDSLRLTEFIPEKKLCGRRNSESLPETLEKVSSKRTQHLSETSDCGSTDSSSCEVLFSDECEMLQEMFPDTCFIEVKHCVTTANGDISRATQLLLHRQESGESLHQNILSMQSNRQPVVGDDELKNRIIERYSYVDKVDTREYKPLIPKNEPKKMIRYRDNKVVSLRGERYTEEAKDAAELKKPKRPIVP